MLFCTLLPDKASCFPDFISVCTPPSLRPFSPEPAAASITFVWSRVLLKIYLPSVHILFLIFLTNRRPSVGSTCTVIALPAREAIAHMVNSMNNPFYSSFIETPLGFCVFFFQMEKIKTVFPASFFLTHQISRVV